MKSERDFFLSMGFANDDVPVFHVATESPFAGKLQCFRCPRLAAFNYVPGLNYAYKGFDEFERRESWLFNHKSEGLFYETVFARGIREVFEGPPSVWQENRPSREAFLRPSDARQRACAAAMPLLGPDEGEDDFWWINWTLIEEGWPASA